MHRLYQVVINTKNGDKNKEERIRDRIEKLDQVAGEGLAEKDI